MTRGERTPEAGGREPAGAGTRRARELVLLASGALAALLAGLYVVAYDAAMIAVQRPCEFGDDRLAPLPAVTRLLAELDLVFLAAPAVALAAGLWLRRSGRSTALTALVAASWLASFGWILLAHLAWLLPLLPLCSPAR